MDDLEQQITSREQTMIGGRPPRAPKSLRGALDWPELEAAEHALPPPVLLVRLIEREVLPRLGHAPNAPAARPQPTEAEVRTLLTLVTGSDEDAPEQHIESLRAEGQRAEDICLGLMTGTARALGEMWEDDTADFVTVTIGLGRLQRLLRHLVQHFAAPLRMDRRRILLATVPGEQHTLGLSMVAAFFERAGWEVRIEQAGSVAALASVAGSTLFDVLGLSAGSNVRLDVLTAAVTAARKASKNPSIKILVGGPLILNTPELLARIGADATAPDGPSAVACADTLTRRPAHKAAENRVTASG